MPGATTYTAASSALANPTISSGGVSWRDIGRNTCTSWRGPSLPAQPAHSARLVSRTSSRVTGPVSHSRQRQRVLDPDDPDRDRERDQDRAEEQRPQRHVAPSQQREQRERDGADHQEHDEDEQDREARHMTLCSRTVAPRWKRSSASAARSMLGGAPVISSAISLPIAGACITPCPENPHAATKPLGWPTNPTIGCASGVSS